MPVGEEAELTNADEAVWKNMLHVAPQELRCRERHQALLVSVRIVLPAESDLLPIERNEPVIADGNAMRIAAQIAEHRFWACHRRFNIDDPVFPMQRLKQSPEGFGIFQWGGCTAETELTPTIRPLQSIEKLASKDLLQNTERKKEAIPRLYPMAAIW